MILKELFTLLEDKLIDHVRSLMKAHDRDETRPLKREGPDELWYVADDSFEAYVVEEVDGKLSFYDMKSRDMYYRNNYVERIIELDELEAVVEEYKIESNSPRDGAIKALLRLYSGKTSALQRMTDDPEIRKKLDDRTKD